MIHMLQVKNLISEIYLHKGILRTANAISLDINRGETLALVGESGSGKTQTALNIIGLSNSYPGVVEGEIQFTFKDQQVDVLKHLSSYTFKSNGKFTKDREGWIKLQNSVFKNLWGNRISIIFQDPLTSLNPYKTVGAHLSEALKLSRIENNRNVVKEAALEWLDKVKIQRPGNVFFSYPFELSGGMAQRVMIAIALASEPEFIILDEPTTGLDVTTQASIVSLLKEIKTSQKITQLLITHDLGLVAHLADKVAVMYAGDILDYGPKDEILNAQDVMRHPYTEGLVASIYRDSGLKIIENDVPNIMDLPSGCPFHPRCSYFLHGRDPFLERKCSFEKPSWKQINDAHAIRCWRFNYGHEND